MDKIQSLIESQIAQFTEIRHHIHENPELSCKEVKTAAYIRSFLDEWKIPYAVNEGTSTVATIRGTKPGKTLALRGDIDALPIEEETGLDWSSKNKGIMHACGHDVHTTFMLASAKILNDLKDEIEGTVKIIFQEGEEIGAGAKKLIDAGFLDGVDSIIALHINPEIDEGIFALGYGTMSSYGSGSVITITADSSTQAIICASQLVSTVSAFISLKFPKEEQIVLVPTVVNTEQNKVSLAYNARTLNVKNEGLIKEAIYTAAEQVQKTFACTTDIFFRGPGEAVNNDRHFTDLARAVIKQNFGDKALSFIRPVMSGEDFALYQQKINGVYIHIGCAQNGLYRALHTSKTFADDKILLQGTEFFVRYALAFFKSEN